MAGCFSLGGIHGWCMFFPCFEGLVYPGLTCIFLGMVSWETDGLDNGHFFVTGIFSYVILYTLLI